MCGIAGAIGHPHAVPTVRAMSDLLVHRGPDGAGIWHDDAAHIALGHRRLAIIDLTDRASQPMLTGDDRFVLVYNGEIYNFKELRRDLENDHRIEFKSESDTEVLLNGFAVWGEGVLDRLNGMFAFALFDRREKKLYLARDRLGVKPLYWARIGTSIVFASELRSLLACQGLSKEISPASLQEFVTVGYVGSPRTLLASVNKLPPATVMTVDAQLTCQVRQYWSAQEYFEAPVVARGGVDEVLDELEPLLADAFAKRMIADVPVGLYLSSGVDSSLLAALLVQRGTQPHAFTLAIRQPGYDESAAAAETARRLNLEHTVEEMSVDDVKRQIFDLPMAFDEPLADTSTLPTLAISKAAARHVKVVLSADGGDELFGGYRRYRWASSIERALGVVPRAGLHWLTRLVRRQVDGRAGPGEAGPRTWKMARNLQKVEDVLSHDDALSRYLQWNAIATRDAIRSLFPGASGGFAAPNAGTENGRSFLDACMLADIRTYLPDDLLIKVDRATMAASMEGRDPFLDHRIVEFCGRLPLEYKIRGGIGKFVLKRLLVRHGLRRPAQTPKRGFSMPVAEWLARDWQALMSEHVNAAALRDLPGFDFTHALALREQFSRGDRSLAGLMYALLCLSMWRAQWRV